jgi:hypothetical protein
MLNTPVPMLKLVMLKDAVLSEKSTAVVLEFKRLLIVTVGLQFISNGTLVDKVTVIVVSAHGLTLS